MTRGFVTLVRGRGVEVRPLSGPFVGAGRCRERRLELGRAKKGRSIWSGSGSKKRPTRRYRKQGTNSDFGRQEGHVPLCRVVGLKVRD